MSDAPRLSIVEIVDNALVLAGSAPVPHMMANAVAEAFEANPRSRSPRLSEEAEFDVLDPEQPAPTDTDWALLRLCASEPQNDIGNSRRLRARYGTELLHVQSVGWHVYDGMRWKEDIDAAGTRPLAHSTVEAVALEAHVLDPNPGEAADIEAADEATRSRAALKRELQELPERSPDARSKTRKDAVSEAIREANGIIERGVAARKAVDQRKEQRRRFANSSGNKGKIDGMLSEALAYLSKPISDLDADPLALNLGNGTLRFVEREVPDPECPDPDMNRTKREFVAELSPHTRGDLIAKLADADYDPGAKAPVFEAFLARILPSEPVREYAQRYFGYSMTALTREQCFCLFHGEGRNGKSTLVDVVARILGDYSTSVPIDTLVGGGPKKGSEATPDLARLPGARLVRTAEPKEGVGFDEALIKGLTSSEPIPVRRLNQEFVDIYPTFKIVVSANRKPTIKGNDDGIWRRVNLLPFDVQIPPNEVDKQLSDKLWAERSGILNWLVAGTLDYLNRGKLDPPQEVTAATQEYRDESDILAAFIRGACTVTHNPADTVEAGRLYQAFEIFCRRNGQTPFMMTTFSRRMPKTASALGFEKGKSSISVYLGLRILPDFMPRLDTPAGPREY